MINLLKIPIIGAHVIAGDISTIESFKSEYIYSIEKTSNEIYIPKNICTIKDKDLLVKNGEYDFSATSSTMISFLEKVIAVTKSNGFIILLYHKLV